MNDDRIGCRILTVYSYITPVYPPKHYATRNFTSLCAILHSRTFNIHASIPPDADRFMVS